MLKFQPIRRFSFLAGSLDWMGFKYSRSNSIESRAETTNHLALPVLIQDGRGEFDCVFRLIEL